MNLSQLFTTFLLMIIGLALTPTVVDQVGSVTGTGGDNLTGATIISIILLIALSVSDGKPHHIVLGNHDPLNRTWQYLCAIQEIRWRGNRVTQGDIIH